MLEIPLNSNPEQTFNVVIAGQKYELRVILNSRIGIWSISFAQNGQNIVTGVALVGGIDILKQYNIGVENMYVVNLSDSSADPTKDNLGTVAKLFVLTEEEIEDVQAV